MYNRRLLITEDEKKYIKNLYGLIQEQEKVVGEKVKIDFGDLYLDGKYLIKKDNEAAFKKKLDSQLQPFVEKNPGVPLKIRVLGGESATTNYDYETNDGKVKEDFYLAKKRRDEMVNWLKGYFETSSIEPKPTVDDTPNEENVNVYRGRTGNAIQDRFVDVVITAQAPDTCLIGLKIEVIYEKDNWSPEFPCRGRDFGKPTFKGHRCDDAIFDVLLNDVNIGEVNLNNKADGGSRIGVVEVTRAQALEIAKKGAFSVKLSLQCKVANCHSDVAEIRISNNSGQIYHSCTPTLSTSRGDLGKKDLLILDKCGTKIIQKSTKMVSASGSAEVKKEYGTQFWDNVAANPKKFIKKLEDGSYEVLRGDFANPDSPGKTFKIGDIIPKPSF
jgi:hypothetical protein